QENTKKGKNKKKYSEYKKILFLAEKALLSYSQMKKIFDEMVKLNNSLVLFIHKKPTISYLVWVFQKNYGLDRIYNMNLIEKIKSKNNEYLIRFTGKELNRENVNNVIDEKDQTFMGMLANSTSKRGKILINKIKKALSLGADIFKLNNKEPQIISIKIKRNERKEDKMDIDDEEIDGEKQKEINTQGLLGFNNQRLPGFNSQGLPGFNTQGRSGFNNQRFP
ncbi:hypothetical protein ACFL5N_00625, partial [bacterium]